MRRRVVEVVPDEARRWRPPPAPALEEREAIAEAHPCRRPMGQPPTLTHQPFAAALGGARP